MWFDPAIVEAVRDAFPAWTAFAFAFFSSLGSVWVVVPAVVGAYLFGDRHRYAPWLAVVIGTYAIMHATKSYFHVGRPGVGPAVDPATLPSLVRLVYAPFVEVGTTSFPSGHTIAGTVLWTMVALETDYGSRRARFAGAATVIALIAFSRIAVGLHFPIDVVAGLAIALCYLALVLSIRNAAAERGPRAGTSAVFATVAVVAFLSTVAVGGLAVTVLLGCALGGSLGWRYAPPSPDPWPLAPGVVARALAILGLFGLVVLVLVPVQGAFGWFSIGVASGAVVVGLPRLVASIENRRPITESRG